jgi:hypothetical protein
MTLRRCENKVCIAAGICGHCTVLRWTLVEVRFGISGKAIKFRCKGMLPCRGKHVILSDDQHCIFRY